MQIPLPAEGPVRIAIRSDRRMFHDTLAACLASRPDLAVVGHVTTGADLLDLCRLRHPDLVLFDAGPDIALSAAALTELRRRHGGVGLIVTYEVLTRAGITVAARVTADALVPYAHGYDALQALVDSHVEVLRSRPAGPPPDEDDLTELERQIIAALSAGHTAGHVAELLRVSLCTVENSKRRLYQKMRVGNQSHAIARAAALGLVDRRAAPQPRPAAPGTVPRVVAFGPNTLVRHRVEATLLGSNIPFTVNPDSGAVVAGRDPVVIVLADPGPEQWHAIDSTDAPILLVRSGPMSRADATAALGRGVVGVLDAERLEHNLVPALTLTAAGHLTISFTTAEGLLARLRAGATEPAPPELTPRERDILRSIASGDTVRQTARTLGIAQKTVENIQARLFRKLNVPNRAGAVASAHWLGLMNPESCDPDRGSGLGLRAHAARGP